MKIGKIFNFRGFRFAKVYDRSMLDFSGMNRRVARMFNFKMPGGVDALISSKLRGRNKVSTMKHEANELSDKKSIKSYWSLHRRAQKRFP